MTRILQESLGKSTNFTLALFRDGCPGKIKSSWLIIVKQPTQLSRCLDSIASWFFWSKLFESLFALIQNTKDQIIVNYFVDQLHDLYE